MAKAEDEKQDSTVSELIGIKRLIIFGLLRAGASQAEVAAALGVSQSSVSRMFPGREDRATKTTRRFQK